MPRSGFGARARALGYCLASCAGALTTQAFAQEPEIPPECGSRAAFDAELSRRLGSAAPPAGVHVSIGPGPKGHRLRVQVGADVRELDDPSCAELFRASVVVALAMLLHDEPARAAPTPAAAPHPAPARSYPLWSLGAGAGLAIGTLPAPTAAFELEGKLLWRWWGVGTGLRYFLPTEHLDAEGRGVRAQAFGASAHGIFRPSRYWQAHVGFAAQRLSGVGTGSIAKTQHDTTWSAGPTLGLSVVPLQSGPWWAGLGAEGQLNAVRGHFQILHYSREVSEQPHDIYRAFGLAFSTFVRLGAVW